MSACEHSKQTFLNITSRIGSVWYIRRVRALLAGPGRLECYRESRLGGNVRKVHASQWWERRTKPSSLDGCLMFAQAYIGRKRWAQPVRTLCNAEETPSAKGRALAEWDESIGRILFRPMYAQANMGHPSRTKAAVTIGSCVANLSWTMQHVSTSVLFMPVRTFADRSPRIFRKHVIEQFMP
jgi:hypothetical protein